MSIFGLAFPEILSDVVVVVVVDGLLLKLLLADGGPPKLKPPVGRPLSLRGIANDPPPVAGDDAADDALKFCNPRDPAPFLLLLLPNIVNEENTKDVLCVSIKTQDRR